MAKAIVIRSFPPFRARLGGKEEIELQVDGELRVTELLSLLAQRYPQFSAPLSAESDERLWRHIMVHRDGVILGRDDIVRPGDRVELLLPAAGGGRRQDARRLCGQDSTG